MSEAAPLRIGIAGLGTVGGGVLGVLARNGRDIARKCGRAIQVAGVTARDRSKARNLPLNGALWFDDVRALAESDAISVFVELIGGEEGLALEGSRRAGRRKACRHRQQGAACAPRRAAGRLAERNGVALNFEAAVAGGIPIVKTCAKACSPTDSPHLRHPERHHNYILTRMQREGLPFAEVLAEAQRSAMPKPIRPSTSMARSGPQACAVASLAFGTE